jgi:hypothetical protein
MLDRIPEVAGVELDLSAYSDAYDAAYWDIVGLYDRGEPLLDYFQREIAPLPPPTV